MAKFLSKCLVVFVSAGLILLIGEPRVADADIISGSNTFENPEITNGNSVFSTITISDRAIIEDVSITIQAIEHSAVGDLIAELRFLGEGGPSGPGCEPAYLFFRPNVDGQPIPGSLANLAGDYTFTTNPNDADFWSESSIPDDEVVDSSIPYFASDPSGDYHDLGGPDFFEGFNTQGQWQLVITDASSIGNNEGSVQGWTIEFEATPIPEPSGLLVLLVGAGSLIRRRR